MISRHERVANDGRKITVREVGARRIAETRIAVAQRIEFAIM